MNSNAQLDMIAKLDLDPIKVKLMHLESGEGWSLEQANAVEFEYRRFLCLMKLFPYEQAAPLFDVDIFWHYHILDTMKYASDCEQIFGYFLHHFPYVGLRGEDDQEVHHRVGVRMQELYESTFGEAYRCNEDRRKVTTIAAWSMNVAQNHSSFLVRPAIESAKTAWSMNVLQSERVTSVRPQLGMAKTAWSMNVAQNDRSYSVRPVRTNLATQ